MNKIKSITLTSKVGSEVERGTYNAERPYLPTTFNGLKDDDGINEWKEKRKNDYNKRNR